MIAARVSFKSPGERGANTTSIDIGVSRGRAPMRVEPFGVSERSPIATRCGGSSVLLPILVVAPAGNEINTVVASNAGTSTRIADSGRRSNRRSDMRLQECTTFESPWCATTSGRCVSTATRLCLREAAVPGTFAAVGVRGSNFLVCLTYEQEIEP